MKDKTLKEKKTKKVKPVKIGKPPKKNKTKTFTIHPDDYDYEVSLRRKFLWEVVDEKRINDKKMKVTFKRGVDTCNSKKGLKKVEVYEEAYRQILNKKVPISLIVFAVLFAGALTASFIVKNQLVWVAMTALYAIFASLCVFLLITYLITMLRKKKLLAIILSEVAQYDLHPSYVDEESQMEIKPEDVAAPYMGDSSQ